MRQRHFDAAEAMECSRDVFVQRRQFTAAHICCPLWGHLLLTWKLGAAWAGASLAVRPTPMVLTPGCSQTALFDHEQSTPYPARHKTPWGSQRETLRFRPRTRLRWDLRNTCNMKSSFFCALWPQLRVVALLKARSLAQSSSVAA